MPGLKYLQDCGLALIEGLLGQCTLDNCGNKSNKNNNSNNKDNNASYELLISDFGCLLVPSSPLLAGFAVQYLLTV